MNLGDIVIHIKIIEAELVCPPSYEKPKDIFVMIRTENTFPKSVFQTTFKNDTLNPVWNEEFYIYPKKENPGDIMFNMLSYRGDRIINERENFVDDYWKYLSNYNLSEDVLKHCIGDHIIFNQEISYNGYKTGRIHFEYDILPRNYSPNQVDTSLDNGNYLKAHIDVINAKLIPSPNGVQPNPFVRVCIDDIRYKSTVLQNTLNPVWNEQFEFNINEKSSDTRLQLYSEGSINPLMSNSYFSLRDIKSGKQYHFNDKIKYDTINGQFQYFIIIFHGDYQKYKEKYHIKSYCIKETNNNTENATKNPKNEYYDDKWIQNTNPNNRNETFFLQQPIKIKVKDDERDWEWGKTFY